MSARLMVAAVPAYGVALCPACRHFLPARLDAEVTCRSCGCTFPVD